ncbi:MAG: hypothetical protein AB7P33_13715 [Dehalococcoidia bacterium]
MQIRKNLFKKAGLAVRLVIGAAGLSLLALSTTSDNPDAAKATAGYAFGSENSWIRVQNVGNADADVDLNYFNESGQLAGTDSCPSDKCDALYPGSGWTFFQKDSAGLPGGFQGSAVISTDQPVVAILAKDVFRGNTFSIAGDTLTMGQGSHRVYLPVTGKRDGPNMDWSGRFVVQNMSDTVQACVQITYLSIQSDSEVAWEPYKLPATGKPANAMAGCPNGGMPLPARGSIFKYPDNMAVSDKFTGSVRIDLLTNSANQGADKQFIQVTADSWNSNLASFGSYRGFDESELGNEIILPLVDNRVGEANSYSTRFTIVNKDPNQPATVTLRYDGYDLDNGAAFVSKTNTFTIKGSRLCFQDSSDNDCLGAGDDLPFNWVGTARLTSNQPLAVVVDRGTYLNDGFTNYRGVRPQDAATKVLLPVLNKNYGSIRGANGWNSWFRVMVADGGSANVTVTYYGLDLPGGQQSYTVKVDREFTAFQHLEWMLPDGFAGTAIITSDRPIVALADIYTDVFSGDPDLVYNGTPLR